jgi:2-aminoadipate transaminase
MLEALERHFPEQATWTRPQGGMFVWATLPPYIDTSDLLAKALRENVAFVPGAAAYVNGQQGGSSMRLNFSGFDEDQIREGIRRIGMVVSEQVALYQTITGEHPLPAGSGERLGPEDPAPPGGDVVPLRGRREDA